MLSFQRALLAFLSAVLLVALLPAGLALDRRLVAELEARARRDLALAPVVLADREAARAEVLKMHAMDVAATPGLARALASGDRERAAATASGASVDVRERPIVLGPERDVWLGPALDTAAVRRVATATGGTTYGRREGSLQTLALVPVVDGARAVGWAGVLVPGAEELAATLSALTGSHVTVVAGPAPLASTVDSLLAVRLAGVEPGADGVRAVELDGARHWVATAPMEDLGHVLFSRSAREELALLPALRRSAAAAGGLALLLSLVAGLVLSSALSRRVRSLAGAAERLADGDFDVALEGSRIREMDRLSASFRAMRDRLAARLRDLARANRELEDRQARLSALQAEMIQRDRLVASGRLVTELAHEIRNPIANIRNCLEVASRRLEPQDGAREFLDLAVDELLRMHELAERMLDLNRPVDPGASRCDADEVVERIAALYRAGGQRRGELAVSGATDRPAAMAPDALKQVLLNVVENAWEAMDDGGSVEIRLGEADAAEGRMVVIHVLDSGPGLPEDVLPRVFDPFFTTKGTARGVGLGLFVAEGLVRRAGGRLVAANRRDGRGARFRIEVPVQGTGGDVADDRSLARDATLERGADR